MFQCGPHNALIIQGCRAPWKAVGPVDDSGDFLGNLGESSLINRAFLPTQPTRCLSKSVGIVLDPNVCQSLGQSHTGSELFLYQECVLLFQYHVPQFIVPVLGHCVSFWRFNELSQGTKRKSTEKWTWWNLVLFGLHPCICSQVEGSQPSLCTSTTDSPKPYGRHF